MIISTASLQACCCSGSQWTGTLSRWSSHWSSELSTGWPKDCRASSKCLFRCLAKYVADDEEPSQAQYQPYPGGTSVRILPPSTICNESSGHPDSIFPSHYSPRCASSWTFGDRS